MILLEALKSTSISNIALNFVISITPSVFLIITNNPLDQHLSWTAWAKITVTHAA
jgi:hypothetical protein